MSSLCILRSITQLSRSCHTHRPSSLLLASLGVHSNDLKARRIVHTSVNLLRKDMPDDYQVHRPVKIPSDEMQYGNLVYAGSISRALYTAKYISLTSSVLGIAVQPILFDRMHDFPKALQVALGGFLGFFVFITPLLLHFIARRYIIRMYLDPETNTFTTITSRFIPVWKKITHFTAYDVKIPPVPGPFTSFNVEQGNKEVPLFVHPAEFLDPKAYVKLMRYDEPMDIIKGPQFTEKVKKHNRKFL